MGNNIFLNTVILHTVLCIINLYRSSGATTINPPQSKRFPNEKGYSPGPDHYNTTDQTGLQSSAKYTLSKHRGSGTRAFTIDKKVNFTTRTSQDLGFIPGN